MPSPEPFEQFPDDKYEKKLVGHYELPNGDLVPIHTIISRSIVDAVVDKDGDQ